MNEELVMKEKNITNEPLVDHDSTILSPIVNKTGLETIRQSIG